MNWDIINMLFLRHEKFDFLTGEIGNGPAQQGPTCLFHILVFENFVAAEETI